MENHVDDNKYSVGLIEQKVVDLLAKNYDTSCKSSQAQTITEKKACCFNEKIKKNIKKKREREITLKAVLKYKFS